MSDLYTDQVHLKRLLAGQATPVFTPLSLDTAKFIDPAFVPGMGALMERPEDGALRCPVKGCGKWYQNLSQHLGLAHRNIGGAFAVKRVLSIPKRLGLVSRELGARKTRMTPIAFRLRGAAMARSAGMFKNRTAPRKSVHRRNIEDSCQAQLAARITSLARTLGRSPTLVDFTEAFGGAITGRVLKVFGTYNMAKAFCGVEHSKPRREKLHRSDVVESMRLFYQANGDLPSTKDRRSPRTPCHDTVKRALGVATWEAAMRSVIEELGITSERYGKPKNKEAA